eukprot:1179848-Prorocentrum_minimum.AAC.2
MAGSLGSTRTVRCHSARAVAIRDLLKFLQFQQIYCKLLHSTWSNERHSTRKEVLHCEVSEAPAIVVTLGTKISRTHQSTGKLTAKLAYSPTELCSGSGWGSRAAARLNGQQLVRVISKLVSLPAGILRFNCVHRPRL